MNLRRYTMGLGKTVEMMALMKMNPPVVRPAPDPDIAGHVIGCHSNQETSAKRALDDVARA
jgi:hypothetical protein